MSARTTIPHYAFPVVTPDLMYLQTGMTLRDWFAGQALAGMNVDAYEPEWAAQWAYRVADAMMEARK